MFLNQPESLYGTYARLLQIIWNTIRIVEGIKLSVVSEEKMRHETFARF